MYNTMSQAKRDFTIGYLTQWRIERVIIGSGWRLFLGSGDGAGWLVDARSKKPRVFKTLDAVVSALTEIGFQVNQLRP